MTHHPRAGHDLRLLVLDASMVLEKASFTPHERNGDDHRRSQQGVLTDEARIRELLLFNLFVVFSERDPERRLKAIVANYTEDVVWSDSEATIHGYEEMNERAQTVLDSTPDFVFNAAGPVHVLRDLGQLAFTYGLPEQPAAVSGSDAALVRDGRIGLLYTLINGLTDRE